jgi:hypothetical protein
MVVLKKTGYMVFKTTLNDMLIRGKLPNLLSGLSSFPDNAIDISGLNKSDVLLALYKHATFEGPGFKFDKKFQKQLIWNALDYKSLANTEKAKQAMKTADETNYYNIDYINLGAGDKPIKIDFSNNVINPTEFDRAHGSGAALRIISELRAEQTAARTYKP